MDGASSDIGTAAYRITRSHTSPLTQQQNDENNAVKQFANSSKTSLLQYDNLNCPFVANKSPQIKSIDLIS